MDERLTKTQLACVRLAGEGLSDKEIARHLKIPSHRTVQRHLLDAYRKLGVRDRDTASAVVRRDYADLPIPISEMPPAIRDRPVAGEPETPPTSYRPPPSGAVATTAIILVFALSGAIIMCGMIVYRVMLAW